MLQTGIGSLPVAVSGMQIPQTRDVFRSVDLLWQACVKRSTSATASTLSREGTATMKSQIHRTMKAHLLRVAFYLLLLLAVCAIPFALAQSRSRGTATRSKARASPASEFLTTSNAAAAPAIAVSVIPPIPAAPAIILYDQMNNPAPTPPPPPPMGSSHRRTTSPNSTIMTASLLTISSCQRARFGISLKWM